MRSGEKKTASNKWPSLRITQRKKKGEERWASAGNLFRCSCGEKGGRKLVIYRFIKLEGRSRNIPRCWAKKGGG